MTELEPRPPTAREESSPSSEAALSRALKRTLAVVLLVGLLVAGVTFLVESLTSPVGTLPSSSDDSAEMSVPPNRLPLTRLVDITASAGIDFVHTNGAYGDKLLPETMGGGVAFLDYDNDGDQDLVFINSSLWPWRVQEGETLPTHGLYHNDGTGRFDNVTVGSGLDFSCYGMGVAVGDYDADGWIDLFITAVGGGHLLRNTGEGRFVEVTQPAGLRFADDDWGTSCAFLDYNNDGWLDLFVCNYLRWSKEIDFEADYQLPGIGRAYGQPWNFPSTFPRLFRNKGDGTFEDVSSASGIQVSNRATGQPLAKSLGVAPVDLDSDGWIDLIVANDTVQNFVFHNERDGTFVEIGATAGVAYDSYGGTRGAMGIDAARFQENSSVGISIGNFANEMTSLYVSGDEPLVFADEAISQGIGRASRQVLTFGVFFFDYDLDGWLDLLAANGHIEDQIEQVQPLQRYRQPAQLFWNAQRVRSGGGFVSVPEGRVGPDLFQPIVGRGSAFADIDQDGDLDVVIAQINGRPLLLRNERHGRPHWLRVQLSDRGPNRQAIGAWVKITAQGRSSWRQVMPTHGYLSQSELTVTFGLGDIDQIDELQVSWPDGKTERILNPSVDHLQIVERAQD